MQALWTSILTSTLMDAYLEWFLPSQVAHITPLLIMNLFYKLKKVSSSIYRKLAPHLTWKVAYISLLLAPTYFCQWLIEFGRKCFHLDFDLEGKLTLPFYWTSTIFGRWFRYKIPQVKEVIDRKLCHIINRVPHSNFPDQVDKSGGRIFGEQQCQLSTTQVARERRPSKELVIRCGFRWRNITELLIYGVYDGK